MGVWATTTSNAAENASYPKYKRNVQALGPAATQPAARLAASDRCPRPHRLVPLLRGLSGPRPWQAEPAAFPKRTRAKSCQAGLGGGGTSRGRWREGGFQEVAVRGRGGRRTWNLKGNPAESVLPNPQLLGMLLRKRSSSSKFGNSCIFQCLYFQQLTLVKHFIWAPGTRAGAFHMDIPAPPTRTSDWIAILFY